MSEFYDKKGKPITMEEWGKLHGDMAYKIIKQEDVGKYWVSTVYLGINHAWEPGEILIFETMVFEGDFSDLDCERYRTEEEALAGHERMVEKYKKLTP